MATTLEISTPDGPAEAYLARPDDGPHPGVLLFMDAIGLRPQIAAMADRIAGWGYTVLAPNFFYRSGTAAETSPTGDLREPGAREAFFGSIGPRMQSLTTDLTNADTRIWIDALESYAPGPIVTTGYCMGARLAVRAAAVAPDLVVGVGGFHGGGLVTEEPDSPHQVLQSGTAYVFGHADNDGSMPAEAVATLGAALEAAGVAHQNEIYAGATHGYTMNDTSMYDQAAAERHYTDLEGLLNRVL